MTRHALSDLLARSADETIIMDGGMGTTSEDRGIDTHNVLWGSFALLTREGVRINDEIHRDFVRAGARLLIANTHNAFRHACEDSDILKFIDVPELSSIAELTDSTARGARIHAHILAEAVASARRAVPGGKGVAVATCIGSVDTPYAIEANLDADEVTDILELEIKARQAVDGGLIILETLTTPEEIEGAARVVINCPSVPIAIGLTCGNDGRTLGGVSMDEVVSRFKDSNPVVYFVQCTRYDFVEAALQALKNAADSDQVLGVYANDGRSWDNEAMRWAQTVRITPEIYAEHAAKWRDMGARLIGGCCGTSPEHIEAIAAID